MSDGQFLAAFRLQPPTRRGRISSFATFNPIFTIAFLSATAAAILYVSFLLEGFFTFGSALLLIAAFLLCFSVFSWNKVTDLKEDSINLPDMGQFTKKNRDYLIFASFEAINIALILAFFTNPVAVAIILFAFLVAFFYGLGHSFRIKDTLVLKNVTIAGTMAAVAVLLPLALHANIAWIVLLLSYFIFVKVFITTVLNDVRDVDGDRKTGVHTIPVSLGRNKTRNLLLIINSTLVLWVAFSLIQGIFYPYAFVLILSVIYGYWVVLRFTRRAKTSRLFYLLVNGEWAFLALYATLFALGWPHLA